MSTWSCLLRLVVFSVVSLSLIITYGRTDHVIENHGNVCVFHLFAALSLFGSPYKRNFQQSCFKTTLYESCEQATAGALSIGRSSFYYLILLVFKFIYQSNVPCVCYAFKVRKMKAKGDISNKICVVVGTITNDLRLYEVPALKVCFQINT